MNDRISRLISALLLIVFVTACNKREDAVIESKYANALVNTFTVDSLLFSIKLNNTPWIDSLSSPVSSVLKQFSFYDTVVHLQVYEKNNFNKVVIDTSINIHLGLNYINIVQLKADEKPSLPVPPAGSAPAAGYCYVKLVYTAPPNAPFLDSVKCEVIVDPNNKPVDTVVLSRYEFTDAYYLVLKKKSSFRVKVSDPVTNSLLRLTDFTDADGYDNYNTVNLVGSTNSFGQTIYTLIRAF